MYYYLTKCNIYNMDNLSIFYYNYCAYAARYAYETFGLYRKKGSFAMQEIYYKVVMVILVAKFAYDIITDIIDKHKTK